MSSLKILLVDDDRNLAITLSDGLHKAMGETISVAVCFSGSEALSVLATQVFDLVISDFNMPGILGLEFLNQIRLDHPKTILVLITAYGSDTLEEEVHRLGIGYVTKPFELSSLVQLIQTLSRGEETSDRTKDVPRILISEGGTGLGHRLGKVMTDPGVPDL